MALEAATYISDLNASNPTAGDPKSQGDDHIRLTKAVMKGQPFGQCRLAKSGANLALTRYNGVYLTINGNAENIPSAGVTLSASALFSGTTYYIYAYMNAGTMTLEASTTTHATDTTSGLEVKSGDATRTLVGMARVITGPSWADTAAQRFVRSWFNDPGVAGLSTFTTGRATTSATYVELNSEIRNEFLIWSNEICLVGGSGVSQQTNANAVNAVAVGFDGVTTLEPGSYSAGYANVAGYAIPYSITYPKSGLSEGYHYVTLAGKVSAGTGTWTGAVVSGSNPDSCGLTVCIKK